MAVAEASEAAKCMQLKAFNTGPKVAQTETLDRERYDLVCAHVAIKDVPSGGLVYRFQLLPIFDNTILAHSYCAQYYKLSCLQIYPYSML